MFHVIDNPGNDDNCLLFITIPPVMECAHDAKENAKKEFGQQNVAKEKLGASRPGVYNLCLPHYFYLYEVWLPMSLSYIYEIRLIKE